MKYLRKFLTAEEVAIAETPNVILVEDTRKVLYNFVKGIFIQHIDGSLYTTDQWTEKGFPNDQANGVAIGEARASFVIAKTNAAASVKWSSNENTLMEGVFTTDIASEARADFAGVANTKSMIASGTSGAAHSCSEFTFPNGSKGYLPALGEWGIVDQYKTDVEAALALIGGEALGDAKYWSSTQRAYNQSWVLNMATKAAVSSFKYFTNVARPFTTL